MNKTSRTAQAARHAINAILAWMDAAPQPLSEWRQSNFARYRPLCHNALLALDSQASLDKGIWLSASFPIWQADDDQEWGETTKHWQVELQPNGIHCTTHTNLATMMGASQSYSFTCTDQEESNEVLIQLGQWELEFDAALARPDVFVNVYER